MLILDAEGGPFFHVLVGDDAFALVKPCYQSGAGVAEGAQDWSDHLKRTSI